MSYVLEDIWKCFKEQLIDPSIASYHFDGPFSRKSFWNHILKNTEYETTVSDSQASRWTAGKVNLNEECLNQIIRHETDVKEAIGDILKELESTDIEEQLKSKCNEYKIYSLLDLDENLKLEDIIYSIIINQPRLTKDKKDSSNNNLCFRNLPYSTTYEHIIPIDAVQNFFNEILPQYHYAIVFGIPGAGKLCQAVYYVMKNNPPYYYYLNFEQSIENTFIHYDFKKACPSFDSEYPLDAQLDSLRKKPNTVLIINNIGENIQGDPNFSSLKNSPIKIIFLSTCRYPDSNNTLDIPCLEMNQCFKLFYDNCPRLQSSSESITPTLRNFINKIERHPLSLELSAKLIQNSSLSLEDIDSQFNRSPLFDSGTFLSHQEKDGSISECTYKDFILNLFDIGNISPFYNKILNYVSLLPRNGYNRISFNILADDSESNKINHLINLGWVRLNEQSNTLSLHPLIQNCFLQKLSPTPALCLPFLKRYINIIETENYNNETEAIWMGLSILNRLQENSSEWFEISYIILNFLRKEKVDYSFIEKLLVKISKIILPENMDLIKGFYIRHVNNMYQLTYGNKYYDQCPDVFMLSYSTSIYCDKCQNAVPSFVLIDLLISQRNNFYELSNTLGYQLKENGIDLKYQLMFLYPHYTFSINSNFPEDIYNLLIENVGPKVAKENYWLLMDAFLINDHMNDLSRHLKTLSSTWINNPDAICSQKVLFYKCDDINQMPKYLQAEFFYSKGIEAIYNRNPDGALKNLYQALSYYRDNHPKYEFYYRNLYCQYLILYCQRKNASSLDEEIIDSLENALNNLPEPKETSRHFIELTEDFYRLLDNLELLPTGN